MRDDFAVSRWRDITAEIVDGTERIGPFRRFDGRALIHLVSEREQDGFAVQVFHHTIDRESPENTTTTIASFTSPALDLTSFTLEPVAPPLGEGEKAALKILDVLLFWTRWLGKTAEYTPVDFADHPAFAGRYTVQSPSASARVREVFRPPVLEALARKPGWSAEAITGQILVFREEVMVPPDGIDAFVSKATAIAALFRSR